MHLYSFICDELHTKDRRQVYKSKVYNIVSETLYGRKGKTDIFVGGTDLLTFV